jgi:ABC-type uncharacterized transport system involved in gliding motility auxiliary subunit
VGRSASLFGLLGLVFLAFGFAGSLIVAAGVRDFIVAANLIAGILLILAYLAFGFEGFRSMVGQRSTRYGASALVYTLLFIVLVGMLDYLGVRYHHRWDVTEAGVYTLSPQSTKVVQGLQDKLQMTAFVEGGINPQLESLLDSYRYAARQHVETRMVDPDKEPQLADQLKITAIPAVALQYGKESFVVAQPTEETITNGVIRVSRTGKKTVYFTEGFGEPSITDQDDPKGFAAAKLALEQENYEVKSLLLPSVENVPDDATVVVLAGPTRPLTDAAVAALGNDLKRGGHLLAMVGPQQGGDALRDLLGQWGATLGNDVVLDQQVRLFQGPTLGTTPLCRTYGNHPVVQGFKDYTIFPQTRTVEPVSGKAGITATALVSTGDSAWAETNVDGVFKQGVASLDPQDRKGPVSVAVAVTAKLKDMGIEPPAGVTDARLVVFGTARAADNQELMGQGGVDRDLFLNSVGWLVGQSELVSVRSRTVRASRAELTAADATRVFYLSVFIIPELLIASGLWVWWRRRSA